MRICKDCESNKPESEYYKGSSKGYSSYCKPCMKIRSRKYWDCKPVEEQRKKRQKAKEKAREKARKFVYSFLLKNPCIDCGESNPIVLDFDHLRDKKFGIAAMIQGNYSVKKIFTEMQKCQVVCSNCHRIRTATRDGHWRLLHGGLKV